jgi:YVTN family beta-propeller protein
MGSRVEIFDISSLQKVDEIIFAPRGFRSEQLTPVDILFDQSGSTGFVALGSANHVVIIDAEKREILKYILVGRRPWGLALTPDEKRLFVLNGLSDDVTIINLDTRRPVRTSRTGLVPHSVEIIN